ncbi:MAG: CDP-alcohol phosphatidyltransferase family protein [Actinobacteria bacterium]|nr:CDP-alcohol phosphatidyltransferase family protein [Actinomycetota bacterium]
MRKPSELNLPNSITILRILALPLCAYVLFKNGGHDSTWRTEFGKLLDPIADKAFIGTAMVGLSILGDLPWWITAVIMFREIGITLFRFAVLKKGVIPANRGGKIKAAFQGFGVGFYVLPLNPSLYWFRDGFMAIAIALTLVTGVIYLIEARKR